MLVSLDIRDLALLARTQMRFRPGLTVLTGETGAGKSILLDALGFALGWKGRAETVAPGAASAEVTAVFELPAVHPARGVLAGAGLPDADELILRRTATADGRRGAFANDRRVSGEILRALTEDLVELHGQQDDRGLLDPRRHRQLLDTFADHAPLMTVVRAAWAELAAARRAQESAESAAATGKAEVEFLRHAVAELDRLDPQPGEDAALDARRRLLRAAGRVGEDIARALAALGHDGAEGPLHDALRWLKGAAEGAEGRLDGAIGALGRVLDELAEAERETSLVLDSLRFDPGELERVEERLFALRAMCRKHGVTAEALPALADDFRARLAAIDGGSARVAALRAEVARTEAAHAAAASCLSGSRRAAATRLDAAMAAELPPLKLDRATFRTRVAPRPPGPEGADDVSFEVATGPGAEPGALNRIASGGELSRFLLALKVCLAARSEGLTMIFDEIDRGVGGATADAVGRRLAALAEGAQVLVVTHSPQVAARAQHHWHIVKRLSEGRAQSEVRELSLTEREAEIARMLAGDTITEAARAAARALMAG